MGGQTCVTTKVCLAYTCYTLLMQNSKEWSNSDFLYDIYICIYVRVYVSIYYLYSVLYWCDSIERATSKHIYVVKTEPHYSMLHFPIIKLFSIMWIFVFSIARNFKDYSFWILGKFITKTWFYLMLRYINLSYLDNNSLFEIISFELLYENKYNK